VSEYLFTYTIFGVVLTRPRAPGEQEDCKIPVVQVFSFTIQGKDDSEAIRIANWLNDYACIEASYE